MRALIPGLDSCRWSLGERNELANLKMLKDSLDGAEGVWDRGVNKWEVERGFWNSAVE